MPCNRTQHCKDFQKAFRQLWKRIQLPNVGCKICLPSSTIDDLDATTKINKQAKNHHFGRQKRLNLQLKSIPTLIPMTYVPSWNLWGEPKQIRPNLVMKQCIRWWPKCHTWCIWRVCKRGIRSCKLQMWMILLEYTILNTFVWHLCDLMLCPMSFTPYICSNSVAISTPTIRSRVWESMAKKASSNRKMSGRWPGDQNLEVWVVRSCKNTAGLFPFRPMTSSNQKKSGCCRRRRCSSVVWFTSHALAEFEPLVMPFAMPSKILHTHTHWKC